MTDYKGTQTRRIWQQRLQVSLKQEINTPIMQARLKKKAM